MKRTVEAPNDLRWTVKRLILPTGLRPLSRTDMLDAAAPRRTVVDGVSRQVPDAMGCLDRTSPARVPLPPARAAAGAVAAAPSPAAVAALDD
jgi:hypothetical protein